MYECRVLDVSFAVLLIASWALTRLTSTEDYLLCVDNVEVDPRRAWCCYWFVDVPSRTKVIACVVIQCVAAGLL